MRHFRSLREYVEALSEIGEIQEIDAEVDWNLELGAIIQRSYELGAPAPLFNRIRGIEAGFRVLGAPAGVSRAHGLARIALSLGWPASATGCQLVEGLAEAHGRLPDSAAARAGRPLQAAQVPRRGRSTLRRLPAPLIHAGDGGRYVNTWGTVIVQTPDRKWTNWSIARIMLAGRNTLTGLVLPRQHLGMIYAQWKKLGRPMPFALAIGTAPAIPFISAMPLADGVNEADFMGAYLGEPLEVVDCETVDLQVPATAEIVLEGMVSVEETVCEGPIGEYTGYLNPGSGAAAARLPSDGHDATAISRSCRSSPPASRLKRTTPAGDWRSAPQVLWELRSAGFPVTACFSPFQSAAHWLVVTVPASYRGQAVAERLVGELAEVLCHSRAGALIPKAILLGDDIDPANLEEVVWAFAARCHPQRGQFLFPNQEVLPLLAFLTTSERETRRSTKVIYHGLPLDDLPAEQLPRRSSFRHGVPPEIQEKVRARLAALWLSRRLTRAIHGGSERPVTAERSEESGLSRDATEILRCAQDDRLPGCAKKLAAPLPLSDVYNRLGELRQAPPAMFHVERHDVPPGSGVGRNCKRQGQPLFRLGRHVDFLPRGGAAAQGVRGAPNGTGSPAASPSRS